MELRRPMVEPPQLRRPMSEEPAPHVFGTKEWAEENYNFISGCQNDCTYCYAKERAIKFKEKTPETWCEETPNLKKVEEPYRTKATRIMFPSTHDITPPHLHLTIQVLRKLVHIVPQVLIVSKPHLICIETICREFAYCKDHILFRFTIGSADNAVLKFWEPNAPALKERLTALQWAFKQGFATSVSAEPLLTATIEAADALYDLVAPFVTDSIWFGKMNFAVRRLEKNGAPAQVLTAARELLIAQDDDFVRALYATYKDDLLVKWKDSIKEALGLQRPGAVGLDI